MAPNERWIAKYKEAKEFIETNHRNPSGYDAEERGLYCNWIRHNRELLKAGELKEDRVEGFKVLMELLEQNKHKNQWM